MSLQSTGESRDKSTVIIPLCLLPNELWALVFSSVTHSQSTLYQCALVNRATYEAINPMLWHSPQLGNEIIAIQFFEGMLYTSEQRRAILGQLIHDLRLNHQYTTDENIIRLLRDQDKSSVFLYRKRLRKRNAKVLHHLPHLLRHMLNLQRLAVSNCFANAIVGHLEYSPLTPRKLYRTQLPQDVFDALAQCPLEDFEWTLDANDSHHLLRRLNACPLRRLAIHDISQVSQRHASDSQLLTPFAQLLVDPIMFPQLTVLELHKCHGINDQVLVAFFNHHPLLEQLSLSHNQIITDATLDAMKLPHLTRLSLTHLERITTAAVQRLITNCPLTYLDVSHSENVDIAGFPGFVVKKGNGLNRRVLDPLALYRHPLNRGLWRRRILEISLTRLRDDRF